ncbi:MAG: dephospho-CoA kinase [Candidatus Eisenbacteria bacterium]|nr:dephospho-CoA kinase [Candidatus Eisenbacteria bacterium]
MTRFAVGLTGGMGAGKSVVAARFASHGADVLTADDIARELLEPGGPLLDRLVGAFGEDIVRSDGTLDRARLAELAFASEVATDRLNTIVHPPLVDELLRRLRENDAEIVVVDAALLAEWGILDAFDVVVAVVAPVEDRVKRLVAAGYTREDVLARMARQMDPEAVANMSDIVIRNEGTLAELEERADEVWRRILALARKEEA